MAMVENLKKFYLYDRWFELEKKTDDELIYWSIPKNSPSRVKINIDLKSNEMTLSYFEDRKLLKQIMITDITQKKVDLHYRDEVCDLLEIGEQKYDNLAIEMFASIINDGVTREYNLMFSKKDVPSNYEWIEPILPIDEKINMNDIDCSSNKVNDFIDFACSFPVAIKKLRPLITQKIEHQEDEKISEVKELIIPDEITVYDRTYHLINFSSNKIFMTNTEDGIRNLEIKYDPIDLALKGVSIKIKDKNKTERVIKIKINDLDCVTVKYYTKIKETVLVNHRKIEGAKINSDMIFDNNNHKVQASVSISNDEEQLYLLEHPLITNNYSDGNGNLYTVSNSGYNTYYGIASFAPWIINGVKEKIYKK